MRCKIFNNYTHGSDPWRVWNTTDCKYTLEALLAGVSTKHATEQPRHLNRDKTQEIHRNTLRNFPLHGLSKHLSWFRCSGKEMHLNRSKTRKIHCNTLRNFPLRGFNKHIHRFRCRGKWEHLNLATRQNPAANPLTANALQDFQQLRMWFRSLAGQECRGMQMHSGGTSGRGIHQTRNRTAQASEPEQNSKNPLQHIEKLSIARFKQAHSQVQMQWKRGASEPRNKAKSNTQLTHNKRIARLSATEL